MYICVNKLALEGICLRDLAAYGNFVNSQLYSTSRLYVIPNLKFDMHVRLRNDLNKRELSESDYIITVNCELYVDTACV